MGVECSCGECVAVSNLLVTVPLGAWRRQQAKKGSLDENNGLGVIFSRLPARQEVGLTYLLVGLCKKEEHKIPNPNIANKGIY